MSEQFDSQVGGCVMGQGCHVLGSLSDEGFSEVISSRKKSTKQPVKDNTVDTQMANIVSPFVHPNGFSLLASDETATLESLVDNQLISESADENLFMEH